MKKENNISTMASKESANVRRCISLPNTHTENLNHDLIIVKGAHQHNLKNIDLTLQKNNLIVFTGVSGSGKSSLVFDTIFAESQRRFINGLSSSEKKHLNRIEKPKVNNIYGLSPAIAIAQKGLGNNPRSTVGTITEIADYLRVLFAKAGTPHCLKCGTPIYKQSPREIAMSICENYSIGELFTIYVPLPVNSPKDFDYIIHKAFKNGFKNLRFNGEIININNGTIKSKENLNSIELVGEQFTIPDTQVEKNKNIFIDYVTESLRNLQKYSKGTFTIESNNGKKSFYTAGELCPICHTNFPKLTPQHFNFNTPVGMCPNCRGLGVQLEIDPNLLIGNENASILDGALSWFGNIRDSKKATNPTGPLDVLFDHYHLDIETPWSDLPDSFKNVILYGSGDEKLKYKSAHGMKETYKAVKGLVPELTRLYYDTDSESARKKYSQYISSKPCKTCHGKRLCPEAIAVKLGGKTISEINTMPIDDVIIWIQDIYSTVDYKTFELSKQLLQDIYNRLTFLMDVGLHYLTLNRTVPTLSGGESQRVRLACQLSSGIVGVLYVLDEPSTGLHPKDIKKLISTLLKLRDQGNTLLVVEHDEEIMKNADWIVDIGPRAGIAGGYIMAQGSSKDILLDNNSLTGKYLSKKLSVGLNKPPENIKESNKWLILKGANHNNLKNVTAHIPIGSLTCITGVSGSGKSSLIGGILEPLLDKHLNAGSKPVGKYESITGTEYLDKLVNVSQAPIGRRPTSNPATYTGLFDKIRKVFANTKYAKQNGLTHDYFSFNSKKGRCEVCSGQGQVKIEMHFLPDVWIPCLECSGKRFKPEILKAKFRGKDISQVLDMDVEEALSFFAGYEDILRILQTLKDVGLEYIKLGQSSTTLSGGEAQRVKLAKELSIETKGKIIYILDEPTTGLHFKDIQYLLNIFHRLVKMGHTLIVIEHDLDIIKIADWIIDLGPEGGTNGGEIVAQGTVRDIMNNPNSFTGQELITSQKKKEILKTQ
ncbi:excinuclease ABC subunit UvrA [Clostridium botulinum]|uniref:excinuclease ABC subunit UvrA n=1 Tax=Clostridium botulinum TaxID=1491 RepID=UPI001FA7E401|nr:excinuclease ABC subunit UvrA [Clostridium botulinum]MCR1146686.1 excinuclease ABC subunit UvrA [Clostridium botulinum]